MEAVDVLDRIDGADDAPRRSGRAAAAGRGCRRSRRPRSAPRRCRAARPRSSSAGARLGLRSRPRASPSASCGCRRPTPIVADEYRQPDRRGNAATSAATSARIRSARAFPSISVASPPENKLSVASANDAESIQARRRNPRHRRRRAASRTTTRRRAQESHTGATVIPVSVVGPLVVELGQYELEEPGGDAARDGPRAGGAARPACAHRRRALGLDVARDEGGRDVGRIQNICAS